MVPVNVDLWEHPKLRRCQGEKYGSVFGALIRLLRILGERVCPVTAAVSLGLGLYRSASTYTTGLDTGAYPALWLFSSNFAR